MIRTVNREETFMPEKPYARTDPAQNFIDRYPQRLDPLFSPKTVAVIGAKDTPGSVGATIMNNLSQPLFSGQIYPVNPKRETVLGLTSYPTIASVPETVDLAVIITPAKTVPGIIKECATAGVKSAIVISAGFKELGGEGTKLENEIVAIAREGKMPVIGPNCLGVMNPIYGLNATFARGMALPGHLAFISQSGAMCTAVLDWSLQEKIGFSAFISIGSMADINWGDLIDYLGNDPHTHSLLLYMETVGDARAFMTAAREVALDKPIIIIKAGRSQAAAKAAASHTGSLAGSDEVFDAALERIGVLRVDSISELFSMASVLARQPRPKGPNLTIITNAGGPAVLATDAAILNGGNLTSLTESTITELDKQLPAAWSHQNPVDILGDAGAERYAKTAELVFKDEQTDGVLVILSPQDMTDPTETAQQLKPFSKLRQKPFLASWMGAKTVKKGADILADAQVSVFDYPDDAAKTFATMWRYSKNLKSLYEVPEIGNEEERHDTSDRRAKVNKVLQQVLEEGRTLLTEFESKQVLELYKIPVVETRIATKKEKAIEQAEGMGYPVVLKLHSQTITHKTDVGGVKLDLQNSADVEKAFESIKESMDRLGQATYFEGVTVQKMIKHKGYELILGSSTDPQFGPVLLFGMGGQLVEVFKDRALAIPPLNRHLAQQLMSKTKIYTALKGVRGKKAVDMAYLEQILVNFSKMIVENPRIQECDINPLIASEEGIIALDARIVLHDRSILEEHLPPLAIRPYPLEYVKTDHLKDNTEITLRPIRPEDETLIIEFHEELSEKSVRQRYFAFVSLDERVAHGRLVRICFNDYDREWAIVAVTKNPKKIVGIGRLTRVPGTEFAQIKMTIADAYQHLGLGTKLLEQLLTIAKHEKIYAIDALILSENIWMIHLCEKFGFKKISKKEQDIVHLRWNNTLL